jgi:hypothetical protein
MARDLNDQSTEIDLKFSAPHPRVMLVQRGPA